jgi:hypothetical protein
MPLELEIIRATEFVRVGAKGEFDLRASKAALATLAAACRRRGLHSAVLDLRALEPGPKPAFTTADLQELVNTFPEVGFDKRLRLAILYRSDPHKRARLFSFLSQLHGWEVRAVGDFEEALLWLSKSPARPDGGRRTPAKQAIPVSFRGRARGSGREAAGGSTD